MKAQFRLFLMNRLSEHIFEESHTFHSKPLTSLMNIKAMAKSSQIQFDRNCGRSLNFKA